MGGIENFPPLWFASSFFLLFLKVSFDLLECLAFGFRHCTKNERDGGIPSHTHVRKKKDVQGVAHLISNLLTYTVHA